MEYRTARDEKIPVLAFLVDESIPWPPEYIEWEYRDKLNTFKEMVKAQVTFRTYKSPEQLATYVTQALALFKDKHRKYQEKNKRFKNVTIITDPFTKLKTIPDLVINIGQAEDGLPLLLKVNRSKDLSIYMEKIAAIITSPDQETSPALLSNFQQSLEQYAADKWVNSQIHSVQMEDGSNKEMYVTTKNLTELTSSLLLRILASTNKDNQFSDSEITELHNSIPPTSVIVDRDKVDSQQPELESVGGLNRFLGITISDGEVFTVGRRSSQWLKWRPFLSESISANLPDIKYEISGHGQRLVVDEDSYRSSLHQFALEYAKFNGKIDASVHLLVSRESVGYLILQIAKSLMQFHKKGKVHGDMKPSNILLTHESPMLIDGFNLNLGERAQGWTPFWSAPEQLISEPIMYSSDFYPIGMMLTCLLGGILIGEVRKFRIPTPNNRTHEYNLFFNPSIYIDTNQEEKLVDGNIVEWLEFLKSCLRFDPTQRPDSVEDLTDRLLFLLEKYPLIGELKVNLLESELVAAKLIDGSESVARLITDKNLMGLDENITEINFLDENSEWGFW
jgi:hypothetical protein